MKTFAPWIGHRMGNTSAAGDFVERREDRAKARSQTKFWGFVKFAFVLRYMLAQSN